jgi:diaminohydroxyphosphoribosylaminopyrimidine deaminase/5-amino-6-(5-phosphoribosylamino)uracil reductase
MVSAGSDAAFMERALFLAERGLGRTSPNPIVGAVVVSDDAVVVGHGAHLEAGGPHAEIVALDEAGARANGATLYCTLEPCSHTGRTGPCVARIVEAGVRRVVAATGDANPQVSGQGFAYLRAHGVEVTENIARDAAERQHAPFFTWVVKRRPYVIVKTALSADRFVGRSDRRVKLTGPAADRFLHRQRAAVDAIAVGSGTMLVDDPLLTPRGAYRFRPLIRLIFDWRGRVPAASRVFATLGTGPVIMAVTASAVARQRAHFRALERRGVIIDEHEEPDLDAALSRLASRDVLTLLVEGGPALHRGLAQARLVDREQFVMTPVRLGQGVAAFRAPAESLQGRRLGDDMLMEFDVHGTDRSNGTY